MLTDIRESPYAKVHGIAHDAVRLTPGFWKDCLELCADSMVPQIRRLFEDNELSLRKVPKEVRLIPYFAWDNRGMGEMRIWFPVSF